MCPRSSDPFYIVSYYIKWVTTSWTHSNSQDSLSWILATNPWSLQIVYFLQIGEVLECLPPGKSYRRKRYNSFDANQVIESGNEENVAPPGGTGTRCELASAVMKSRENGIQEPEEEEPQVQLLSSPNSVSQTLSMDRDWVLYLTHCYGRLARLMINAGSKSWEVYGSGSGSITLFVSVSLLSYAGFLSFSRSLNLIN